MRELLAALSPWSLLRMAVNQSHSIDAESDPHSTAVHDVESVETSSSPEAAGIEDALFLNDPRGEEISSPFVNRWEVLVSTTNWEKGRIICEWRSALESDGAPVTAYSDEAWSRRVGGVTSQHVGRLRRVFTKFGGSYGSYANLSWTHFLAALEWDDAEMWLQGASESKWSVSELRNARWVTLGSKPEEQPIAADISASAADEDFTPLAEPIASSATADRDGEVAEGPRYDGPDFGDEEQPSGAAAEASDDDDEMPWNEVTAEPLSSPFATLPKLPVDVADALEQFKLAIIRHRANSWEEIPQEDMLRAVDALRQFASQ